jgi:hypothetical protein
MIVCEFEDFYSVLYYFERRVVFLDLTVDNILYYIFYQVSMTVYLGLV